MFHSHHGNIEMLEFERSRRAKKTLPNMLGLINVIFLMLIFFMVAGKFEPINPVDVELPTADFSHIVDPGQIVVSIGKDGQLTLNFEPITHEALEPSLAALIKDQPNAVLSIKADARLNASHMVDAMQAAKRAGAVTISITTQSRKEVVPVGGAL